MIMLYPVGLAVLAAVPVLIFIYIIKNRYTEQTISSTYLWRLSEKFLKRRVPISKLAGIISLLLQILLVAAVSFAVVQPSLVKKNAARSYCFVLDGSGSMNIVQDGETRYDIAKSEIVKIIDKAVSGSDYTLISSGSTTDYIFEEVVDKKAAKSIIEDLSVQYVPMDNTDALIVAQEYFNYNPSVKIYLLTDKEYQLSENVEIIDVSKLVENYSITDVDYELFGGFTRVTGTVKSHVTETTLTVNVYFDGEATPTETQQVAATAEGAEFEFLCGVANFGYFKVTIANEDALALDNEVIIYNVASQNISKVLLVSDSPFFMRASLRAAGISHIILKTTEDYVNYNEFTDTDEEGNTGYGLYIFDSFMPEILPDDGAVWFINPNRTLDGTNFSFQQGDIIPRSAADYSDSTETSVTNLLQGIVDLEDKTRDTSFHLGKYVKCGLNGKFITLASCDNNPILFVGSNVYGNREVVFSFDLLESAEYLLLGTLPTLVKNLIDYSFPTVINDTSYVCGDIVQVNMIPGCSSIRIETPNGNKAYPSSGVATTEYRLTEVGVYNIVLVMKDKTERVINVFAELPEEEREPVTLGTSFYITGTAEKNYPDEHIEILLYIFILIAILAVADYGLYCYEQYQLR